MNDKTIVGNSMKDAIKPIPAAIDSPRMMMSGSTITNPDGSKDYVAVCVSSDILNAHRDPEIKGVVLRASKELDADAQIKEATGGKSLDEVLEHAEDETYALPADKGVVVQVIPDDQMPTDVADVPAEMLIAPRRLGCPNADFDMDILYSFPSHAVIPVYAKPKARINRQRQGYSRRKAKRAYQARAAHQVKLTRYKRRGRGYMLLLDENGNPVNLKSDIHIAQAMGRAEVGSYMQPTKPSGYNNKGV
jgi:hypothetical protein